MAILNQFYVCKTGDYVSKYSFCIDEKRLLKIRKEIISSCCKVNHVKKQGIALARPDYVGIEIQSYQERPLYHESQQKGTDVYLMEYDEYIFPSIIALIDRLLLGDITAYDEIKTHAVESESYEKAILMSEQRCIIGQLKVPYTKITSSLMNRFLKIKEELEQLEAKEKNEAILEQYRTDVLDCIELTLVDTTSVSSFQSGQRGDRTSNLVKANIY